MDPLDLVVVLPVYNEAANLASVLAEWDAAFGRLEINYVLVAVNDGSRDGTGAVLAGLAVHYGDRLQIIEQVNAGHGRACRAGYAYALTRGAPWTLQIDSDGQCDPAYFPKFWEVRLPADCLFGLRTSRDDGVGRVLVSAACRWGTSLVCGVDLKDANVPYRLIRTEALRAALARIPEDFDMQNVALTIALRRDRTRRWVFLPIHFRDRRAGTNSINLRRIVVMGWKLLWGLNRVR